MITATTTQMITVTTHTDDHSHDHADAISKTIDIAGTQLVISIEGTVTANAELHVEITAANADKISALRLWFGTQIW